MELIWWVVLYLGIGVVFSAVLLVRNIRAGDADLDMKWKAIFAYLFVVVFWVLVLALLIASGPLARSESAKYGEEGYVSEEKSW